MTRDQLNAIYDILEVFEADYDGLTGDPYTQKLTHKLDELKAAIITALERSTK